MNSINRRNANTKSGLDFYATDPIAIDKLLAAESFDKNVWECAAGSGHLSDRLCEYGYRVKATDIYDWGGNNIIVGVDFLTHTHTHSMVTLLQIHPIT